MSQRLYLGVDIGTYETKGILVKQDGKIISIASRKHKMIVPQKGWAEHRPNEDWWGDFVYVCKKLIIESNCKPEDIKAVATSAIGPCMLPVDNYGKALMNGVLYGVDTRASKEIKYLNNKIGKENIINFCGNALTSQSVGPKILWLKKNFPEIFSKTFKILNSTSFIVYRLTGKYVIDHLTAVNFTPLYDIKSQCWSNELSNEIIDINLLPEILWSNEIAGEITEQASKETGLKLGTPVTTGTIDAAAEALSVGVNNSGDMMMMYGSTMFFYVLTDSKIFDDRLWYAPWLFPKENCLSAGLATSGTLTHWFRDNFAKELQEETAFVDLAKEAEKSDIGSKGLIFLPYFSGERTPIHDTHAKGTFFGLNLTHERKDLYRSIFEGIAYGTRHVFETYAKIGNTPKEVFSVGGGIKNQIWSKTTSDITGANQIIRQITIGASYGDAFLAAVAIGDSNRENIHEWNPIEFEIKSEPNEIYEKGYKIFRNLYEQTKDIMKELDN